MKKSKQSLICPNFLTGFTLIELLVVIAIIAVLAAIIAPNAFKAIEKAKIAKIARDMKALKTAWLALYADIGLFPNENVYPSDPGFPFDDEPPIHWTDIASDVNNYTAWDGPYYDGANISPYAQVYRYDNDGDSFPANGIWAGVNICFRGADTNPTGARVGGKLDEFMDDGVSNQGSIRYREGVGAIWYMVSPGG